MKIFQPSFELIQSETISFSRPREEAGRRRFILSEDKKRMEERTNSGPARAGRIEMTASSSSPLHFNAPPITVTVTTVTTATPIPAGILQPLYSSL